MQLLRAALLFFFVLSIVSGARAQRAEITISLSEDFFDALLDAVFQNGGPPEFAISQINPAQKTPEIPTRSIDAAGGIGNSFAPSAPSTCIEAIKLQREISGVRTAVRFRDGKIYAPIAFTGNYNPPLIGCMAFGGYGETNVDLEFDRAGQRLIARANVFNVSLNGTGGVGGNMIARMVQNSIDRKINPIEILRLDKISFLVPIQNTPGLRMKAVGIRHEITNGTLFVHIAYEFIKA